MRTTLNPERCKDESVTAHEHANVNNVRVNLGAPTIATVMALVTIIGACGVVIGLDISDRDAIAREHAQQLVEIERHDRDREVALHDTMQDLQRQYRMVELKLDDWTVVAHRRGLVLPGDYTRGPQGDLDSESFKQPKGK